MGDGLLRWFDEGVELLVSTLKTADPDEECRNFSPGSPNTVQFWRRRQAHETSMHRWDVESAVGQRSTIDADLATDGIDELFHTFTRTRGKQVLAGPIRIVTTDSGAAWRLGPTSQPGRVDLVPEGGDAVATLAGPAEDLLLALWKRITLDEADVQIDGAEDSVRQFVAGPISP